MKENTVILVNLDTLEYLVPSAFGEGPNAAQVIGSDEGILTGLAVLLSDTEDSGGGDLNSDSPIVGSWAGCRVGLVDQTTPVTPEIAKKHVKLLEQLPLLKQVLKYGKDVSNSVIRAIVQSEGDYYVPAWFNTKHCIDLPVQRTQFLNCYPTRAYAIRKSLQKKALPRVEDFFGVFG